MLVIEQDAVDRPDLQGAYFDGSLELLRELAVTNDLDTALPRLSAIMTKMLPHDALRMACFDQRGQLVVNASTADVPDITTSDGEEVIVDDLRTRAGGSAAPHTPERLVGDGYRTMAKDRVAVPVVAVAFAVLFFGLGSYLGARPSVDSPQGLAALRAEIDLLRKQPEVAPTRIAGISPVVEAPVFDHEKRAAIVADVKRQLQTEMGLLPLTLIRDRRHSFVELHSYDDRGASSYGTAGYLGNGYFITVKHAVVALGQEGAADPRVINSIELMIDGRPISARVVDAGDARVEVDPGDWAILKVKEDVDLPALNVALSYQFEFADPIFRLGNDYSKGIVVSTGYVGQRTPNKLVTCLTDGHPGVSGGGVLNAEGRLVGIPIGRMQGDFRFSFILPLRDEMFQKVK
jgi:S1-C subfamily serine protease